jgi:hypothetical protein
LIQLPSHTAHSELEQGFRSAEIGGQSEEAAKYSQGENVATLGHGSSVPNNWP